MTLFIVITQLDGTFKNIFDKYSCESADCVAKFDKFNDVSDEQPSNIEQNMTTLVVSKFDKSNDVSDEQFLNIPFICVTFDVSKCDKSNDVSDEQSLNILSIIVTLGVRIVDRLIKDKLLQISNIAVMSVTEPV